jgi:uncharacterized protein DUF6335
MAAKRAKGASRTRKAVKRGSRKAKAAKAGARAAKTAKRGTRTAKRATRAAKTAKPGRKAASPRAARRTAAKPAAKVPRLNRARRTLNDDVVQTPPSSLNMNRHGSAARTGRAEYADNIREHRGMNEVTAGDVDVDVEDAFFTGEEAPGGDNPTPDQDIVDDIGKALGVEYADNEELKAADKVTKRDKHRWELDPASSEDYKERD